MIKLNMGCSSSHKPREEGWVNVDKYPPADLIYDLESYGFYEAGDGSFEKRYRPWPWKDNEVDEVLFNHSLEHMGDTTDGFFHIIKELYRVCKPNALIAINAPFARHDDFLNDPTHVRIITPQILGLFSKEKNNFWLQKGCSNSPLGLQLNVDFVIEQCGYVLEDYFKGYPEAALKDAMMTKHNVIKQYSYVLRCVK